MSPIYVGTTQVTNPNVGSLPVQAVYHGGKNAFMRTTRSTIRSHVASSAASGTTTRTVVRPTGLKEGDLLLAMLATSEGGVGSAKMNTDYSGWHLVGESSSGTGEVTIALYYKVATPTDLANNYQATVTSTATLRSDVFAIYNYGVKANGEPEIVHAFQNNAASLTSFSAPSVTPTAASGALISSLSTRGQAGATTSFSWTSSPMTEFTDATASSLLTMSTARLNINGTTATGTRAFALTTNSTVARPGMGLSVYIPTAANFDISPDAAVWHAKIAEFGMSKYDAIVPPDMVRGVDWDTVADPKGSGASVLYFDSYSGKTWSNTLNRSSARTPFLIRPTSATNPGVYYTRFTFLLPADQAMTASTQYNTMAHFNYASPYGGAEPTGIAIVRPNTAGPHILQLGGVRANLGTAADFPMDTWVTVTLAYKFDYDGWVEMWLDRGGGAGHERILINGVERYPYDVRRTSVNDGGDAYANFGCYGNLMHRLYLKDHIVATTWAGLAPVP